MQAFLANWGWKKNILQIGDGKEVILVGNHYRLLCLKHLEHISS